MKKIILGLFIGILIISCCEDQVVASYKLNQSERNLIPFTDFKRLNYKDQNNDKLIGLTQPKKYEIETDRDGPESCDLREFESMDNFIAFENRDFVFRLSVSKLNETVIFQMDKSILDSINSQEYFSLDCESSSIYYEELITDISLQNFDFENILIFSDCDNISEINRVIYSKEKGIEFIEYDNNNYIKLED